MECCSSKSARSDNCSSVDRPARGVANVPDQWLDAHRKVQTGIARRLEYFDCLADEFAQTGITVVLSRMVGSLAGYHSCFGCCPMGVIDVLVNRRDFLAAHAALKNGLQFEFQNPHETKTLDHAISHGGAEYKKRISEQNILLLELQWRPVARRI